MCGIYSVHHLYVIRSSNNEKQMIKKRKINVGQRDLPVTLNEQTIIEWNDERQRKNDNIPIFLLQGESNGTGKATK